MSGAAGAAGANAIAAEPINNDGSILFRIDNREYEFDPTSVQ